VQKKNRRRAISRKTFGILWKELDFHRVGRGIDRVHFAPGKKQLLFHVKSFQGLTSKTSNKVSFPYPIYFWILWLPGSLYERN
jgi:hypothetical protein